MYANPTHSSVLDPADYRGVGRIHLLHCNVGEQRIAMQRANNLAVRKARQLTISGNIFSTGRQLLLAPTEVELLDHERLLFPRRILNYCLCSPAHSIKALISGFPVRHTSYRQAMHEIAESVRFSYGQMVGIDIHTHGAKRRLLEPLGYIPPAEAEALYYNQLPELPMAA